MSTRVLGELDELRILGSSYEVVREAPIAETTSRSTLRSYRLLLAGILASDVACVLVGQTAAHVVVHGWVAPSPGTVVAEREGIARG